jgi:phthalate 4,5-cis-dihydrodiol dehydrogenase
MLGVGIIGAGHFGEKHAEAIAELDNVRLVASSRTNETALNEFVRKYGGRAYTDYRNLLADNAVDTVMIATPHHLHTDIALLAAKAGKHILLEKPMAPTLDECDQIIQDANEFGVKLMVGHTNRFLPAYQKAKEIIDSGELGEIVFGNSIMCKFWMESNRRDWHLDRDTAGGMWLTVGIHCLDRLTWLIDSSIQSVCAQFDTRSHDQKADDIGLIFLRYANGTMGTVTSIGYATGTPQNFAQITCTKGVLKIDKNGVHIGRDEKWQQVSDSNVDNNSHRALVNEWKAFIKAIQEDTEPAVGGAFARHIMAAVFAAEESSRMKQEIVVPQ